MKRTARPCFLCLDELPGTATSGCRPVFILQNSRLGSDTVLVEIEIRPWLQYRLQETKMVSHQGGEIEQQSKKCVKNSGCPTIAHATVKSQLILENKYTGIWNRSSWGLNSIEQNRNGAASPNTTCAAALGTDARGSSSFSEFDQ